jgi:4-hydroxy-4-methyl-2-oxoglutarate aldolase
MEPAIGMDASTKITERLEKAYSGAVFDVLREMGFPNQAFPHNIKPLNPQWKLAGPVFTLSGAIKQVTQDESMVRWCDFLSQAPAGHVVVCQPNDDVLAHMGELSSETLKFRGIRGYVVDGGCRDTDFILKLDFPVFCRYLTPGDIVGKWLVETVGEPIKIADHSVETGDYVMGDIDGVVLIPKAVVNDCVDRVEQVINTESLVRKAILAGEDPKQAYLKYGRF